MDLTEEQWKIAWNPSCRKIRVRDDGRGRPWSDRRKVLNGVLWIFREPERHGKTCHRDMDHTRPHTGASKTGSSAGSWSILLLTLAQHLKDAGGLDLKECFVDGTFVPAKKRGDKWGKPSGARAPRSWALQTAMVFLSPCGQKARFSPAEVKLVSAATLEERIVAEVPERLIGDKAYRQRSARRTTDAGARHGNDCTQQSFNRRVPTQDGRPLRRYVRRYKIERLFAWLFNFRRLVVRYEYHAENFQGLVHLAAAVILLRHL